MNKYDKILIGVLLLAAVSFSFIYQSFIKEAGSQVVVSVDGKEHQRLDLYEDASFYIEGVNGGTNYLVIEGGKAKLYEATCPDLVCVRQRAIQYNGESIICLPNKVVVKVEGGKEQDVDAVQ